MPVIEARHVALWLKADPLTKPGPDETPPTYGAHHRNRAGRTVEVDEADETPGQLVALANED